MLLSVFALFKWSSKQGMDNSHKVALANHNPSPCHTSHFPSQYCLSVPIQQRIPSQCRGSFIINYDDNVVYDLHLFHTYYIFHMDNKGNSVNTQRKGIMGYNT